MLKNALLVTLSALTLFYIVRWFVLARRALAAGAVERGRPTALELVVGFVTNFFDTLGIGSFAPTTSVFRLRRLVPDERIPGTLNAGHTIPSITEALIFVAIVEVDAVTLAAMLAAAVVGAWLGAGVVATWPRRRIQVGMGIALFLAAGFFAMTNLGLFPGGGTALSLSGGLLAAGLVGNFALGALMTLGIGLYAPCMILVALLGMNPTAAFPIMMGSCAFLMPVASLRFIGKDSYSLGPAMGLTLGGIPGVLIAAFIVKSLPLTALRWLVVAVVLYTAVTLLRAAMRREAVPAATGAPAV